MNLMVDAALSEGVAMCQLVVSKHKLKERVSGKR
jgi:hypothetical protein